MMRFLRRLLVVLIVLGAIFVGVGLMLPGAIKVERSALIQAAPSTLFPLVNDLRQFNRWSPWAARDPQTKYAFTGPQSGVGARMTWESAQLGTGAQEIVESVPDQRVVTALDFGDVGTARAGLYLVPEGGGTRVSWDLETNLPYNPLSRWIGLMFDRWIGADYEEGLARLKSLAEKGSV